MKKQTKTQANKEVSLVPRAPVVVVLGHVDHGKSSLLEAIREDIKITAKEAGGITQHVGAYEVEHKGKKITFLDTPGHEAFSAIRSRGAKVADIAVLVVAGDEGVKTQTKEAIAHAKREGLALIVAVNKIDKPEANPQKVYNELAKEGVLVEQMGGKVPAVEVSAKTKQGLDALLDIITLVAEIEGLQASLDVPADGAVIEAYLDSKRGPIATLLVQNGILRLGDIIGTPSAVGKVKALEDFLGQPITEAYPSTPAVVLGFEQVPKVGEVFKVFPNLAMARESIIEARREKGAIFQKTDKRILSLVIKADAQGSLEAIEKIVNNLPQEKVGINIVHQSLGNITENDVSLAASIKGVVIGFRVKINPSALKMAEREGVIVKNFEVIYELEEGVKKIMEMQLEPEIVRRDLGKMKVLVVFFSEKDRQIVGGKVLEGEFRKGMQVEVLRNEEVVGRGKIANLQENKRDIEKAKPGQEIGILYEGEGKILEGDIIVAYTKEKIIPSL